MTSPENARTAAPRSSLRRTLLAATVLLAFASPGLVAQEPPAGRGVRPAARRELLDQGFLPYERKVALVVGIDDYPAGVGSLGYAVRDARAVEELLLRVLGFHEVEVLEDAGARRDDILQAIVALRHSLNPGDQFLFYFAGHGVTFGDGADEMGYLLPQDVRRRDDEAAVTVDGLSMSELRRLLVRLPAKHVLLVVDACYSGYAGVTSRGTGRSPEAADYLRTITRERARQLLTAGRRDERSLESDRWGHSAFTYKLLQGLGEHLADSDRNGIVPVLELATYLSKAVHDLTDGAQTPQFADLTSDEGEFVFILPELSGKRRIQLSQPSSLAISGDRVEVRDRLGEVLWRHTASGTIAAGEIVDLDGDGVGEVVVALGADGDAGRVLAFDFRGDLRWSRDPPRTSIYEGASSGRLAVTDMAAGDLLGDGRRQVALLWSDAEGWPVASVALLDGGGQLVGSYWNPGQLHGMVLVRRRDEGRWRILVHGFNNDLAPSYPGAGFLSALFVLDPRNLKNQAPPYGGEGGRGTQLWYAVLSPRSRRVEKVDLDDVDGDGSRDVAVTLDTGQLLHLSLDGAPLDPGVARLVAPEARSATTGAAGFVFVE